MGTTQRAGIYATAMGAIHQAYQRWNQMRAFDQNMKAHRNAHHISVAYPRHRSPSKYKPHQGAQECARRVRQMARGII